MKNLYLDTNILIDFLSDHKPFSASAATLFSLAQEGKVTLYISATACNNIYHVLRKSHSHRQTMELLDELSQLVEICDVTHAVIKRSLKTSFFKDFEDAIEYNCALSIRGLSCIVTRNARDYKKSAIAVVSPQEAVALF